MKAVDSYCNGATRWSSAFELPTRLFSPHPRLTGDSRRSDSFPPVPSQSIPYTRQTQPSPVAISAGFRDPQFDFLPI
jgi:hypothetical protein